MTSAIIHRDDWGVPHVTADTEPAGFFGLGYAQAEDHLPEMLGNYLRLAGQAAEVLGPQAAAGDSWQLRWRHLEESRSGFARLPPALQDCVTGFIQGIERYMTTHASAVPDWAPPLEPALPLGIYRMSLWGYMIADGLAAAAAAGVQLDPQVAAELTSLTQQGASNAWMLAPWRTADDALALLSDPHGTIDGFPMFEVRLRAGGVDAVGVTAIGAAVPILGHTATVAWGMTTGAPRVSDCYYLELEPDDSYRIGDGERRTLTRTEVRVHGQARSFDYVEHNAVLCPVVARAGSRVWVVCTPYQHDGGGLDRELFGFLHAATVADVRREMRSVSMFPQNVLVADASGDSWYVRAGRVPRRGTGVDWTRPVNAADSRMAWQGLHRLEELVQVSNPECGYLQNNNVAPDTMFPGAEDLGHDAPAYLFNDEPGRSHGRGRRALELLDHCQQADFETIRDIALDDYWPGTQRWQRALDDAVAAIPPDLPELARAAALILAFDGFARPDSAGALAYWAWRRAVGADRRAGGCVSAIENGRALPPADQQVLIRSLGLAVDVDGRTYGDMFRVRRGSQDWPGRGGMFSVLDGVPVQDHRDVVAPLRVMQFGEPDQDGRRWVIGGGRSLRLTQFTDPIRSFSVVLYGQSGDAESAHYADQIRLYSQGELRSTYFHADELAAHTERTYTVSAMA